MWLMLNQDEPDDYVVATGTAHSVEDLVRTAFEVVGLNWQEFVKIDKSLFVPPKSIILLGDASKACRVLGWETHVTFEQLVAMMVEQDVYRVRHGLPLHVACSAEGT